MKFSNPFKRKPCPELDALKERLEAAQKIADPAEKYIALTGVMSDALTNSFEQGLGPLKSENYYPTMGKSVAVAAVVSLGAALVFAPALPAIIGVTVLGGGLGGTVLGMGAVSYQQRMGYEKEYMAVYEQVSPLMGQAEKATTHVAATQSPAFEGFSKQYPRLAEVFREEARKEKIDALPPDVAAKLLGDAPKPASDKPGQDKPGLAL